MSTTTLTRRGAEEAAQAGARADRKGWLASVQDEAVSFLKGDNNAPWAILAETVIGCVPVLGQVVDARDILKALVEVSSAPASPLAWFNLITALIGLIPGGGDAVKRSLRAVKSGAVHTDELLAMIRRLYKGDPEKLLREVLDLSRLRKTLDDILANPTLTKRLSPELKQSVAQIRQNLSQQFSAFKREVDGWLAKGRKTSADAGVGGHAARGTPAAKPDTQAKAGTQRRKDDHDTAAPAAPNAAQQRTARFKSLTQKVLGVLGEHMADYHCQDVLGWGEKAAHDTSQVNAAKLNDGGRLVNLWPCVPRGRGIDAVWKTTGASKPYAIIEAKASYNPAKSLKALLGEAGDKTERQDPNGGELRRRGGQGGQSNAGGTAIRQTNGKVTQMGHAWIERRLPAALAAHPLDLARFRKLKNEIYTRHVLFFSIPQAISHAEALIKLSAQQPVQQNVHGSHAVTREWKDAAIDKVVDNRAGLQGEARDARRR
jgi:hypothetical protein